MAILYVPSGSENSLAQRVYFNDEEGLTLVDLKRELGEHLAYVDVSDEYVMIVNKIRQELKVGGYNAIATKMAYRIDTDENKSYFGAVIIADYDEISEELKIKEEIHE